MFILLFVVSRHELVLFRQLRRSAISTIVVALAKSIHFDHKSDIQLEDNENDVYTVNSIHDVSRELKTFASRSFRLYIASLFNGRNTDVVLYRNQFNLTESNQLIQKVRSKCCD